MKTYDMRGKVAVVLGCSAKNGIGWATALALGKAGAKVVVAARTYEPLKQLAEEIDGTAVACDAGKEADVAALAQRTIETYGRLDIAITFAASQEPGLIQSFDLEKVRKVAEVNYFGGLNFLKYMSLAMEPKSPGEEGSIVLLSSIMSTHARVSVFPYGISKAAVDAMVRYAALELAPKRIKVNSILSGPVYSDMTEPLFSIPGVEAVYEKEIPFGRIGNPEDIVDAIMWLSDGAYVTGLNLHVSGGMHLTRCPFPDEYPPEAMKALANAKPPSERGQ